MLRFALEIIHGIRDACGPDYPIGIRISACEYLDYNGLIRRKGITLELFKQYAKLFEAAGVDLLDVSAGIYETMNTAWEPTGFDQAGKRLWPGNSKKTVVNIPVVCTSVIRSRTMQSSCCRNTPATSSAPPGLIWRIPRGQIRL